MESALVQSLLAGLIVLGAAVYLVRRAWRTVVASRRAKADAAAGCAAGSACGCEGVASASKRDALTR